MNNTNHRLLCSSIYIHGRHDIFLLLNNTETSNRRASRRVNTPRMMRYVALVCVFIEIFSEVNCTKSASLPFRNRLQSGFLGLGVDGMNDPSFSGNNLDSGFENRFPFNRRSFSLPDSPFMGRGNMGQFSMPGTSYRYGDLFSDNTPSVYNFPPSFMTGSRGNQMFDPFQSSGFNNFPSNGFDQIDPFGGFSPVSQNTMRDFPTRGFGSSIGNSFDDTINYPGIARIRQSTVIPGGVNSRFLSPRFGNPSGFDRFPLTRGGNGLGFNRFPFTRGGNGLGFNESPFSRMGDLSAIGGFPSTGNNLGFSGLAGFGSFPSARSNGLGIFAKSATVICAVGITFGFGGYILYKLYCRLIQPLLKNPPKKEKVEKGNETQDSKDINGLEIDTSMGNSSSNKADTSAYFSPVTGVALNVGRKSQSRENLKTQIDSSRVRQRKRTKRRKTSTENELTKSMPMKLPSSDSELSLNRLIHSASDVSNVDLEGSLKANVSLQSLSDRNMRDIETFRHGASQSSVHTDLFIQHLLPETQNFDCIPDLSIDNDIRNKNDNISNKENCDTQTSSNKFHIELSDDLLTVSSILLTPPSEDDSHVNSSRFHNPHSITRNPLVLHDCNNLSQFPLSSFSSDNNTDSKKSGTDDYCVSIADESCSCDEKDSVTSLPKLRSPDRFFRETLLHRLQECHNGAASSNSSSLDSSPEFSPYARNRKYSIEIDNLSEQGTPDSEIFSSYCEVGRSTEDQFEHLEEEVLDIEEEFASLANKLNQLKNIAVNSDSSSLEYSPSHPLAKKAVEIVDRTRRRLSRSHSVSGSSNDSSPVYSFDMPDLSWDSEGLHGDNSNKSSPNIRRGSEPAISLRNRLHTKFMSKCTNGYNGVSFESPMETDVEKDGTLDNLSTDDCFEIGSHSDWTEDSSSENYSKTDFSSSAKESMGTDSKSDSMSGAFSSSVFESARDSSQSSDLVSIGDNCKHGTVTSGVIRSNNSQKKNSTKVNVGTTQVSEKIDITEYVEREWKGQTDKANTIRQAYKEIPKETGCHHLCRIRGDNYCGLRGTLFQCLCHGIDLSNRWPSLNHITDKLAQRYSETNSGLKQWTFANRLTCPDDQHLSMMSHCISLLFSKIEECRSYDSKSARVIWTSNLLNSDPICDLYLMEGLKLLMFLDSLDLNDSREIGEDVPIFVWLLFARDTSETPLMFLKNHLNTLGDSGGIEQIEMYLLGHTLGVHIQVIRLSQFGQEDFVAYYPDDAGNNWPQVSLIAEDDRHYNVPVP